MEVSSPDLTVRVLLGLTLVQEPARYVIGCEPAEPPAPRPPRCRARPLDRRLVSPFYAAAKAGVSDADLARAANVTVSQVRGWRLRLGLRRKPGTTTMAKIHGAILATPELVRMLRSYEHVDDADPPPAVRIPYEELAPLLEARGLGFRQLHDTQFRERPSVDFGRRTP